MKLLRLAIRHLPGIDRPFAVDFAPHTINLITGPNGSGKSSLVRAVRALLQVQRDDPYIQISSIWQDAEGELHCERSGPVLQWRRAGQLVVSPRLPGPEAIGAYLISSEDLAAPGQTDSHIASELQTLLAGGYDLDAVLAAPPFDAPARPQKLAREIDRIQRQIAAKEAEYTALHEQIEQLQALEAELDKASRSANLLTAVDDAIALGNAHTAQAAAIKTLAEDFPAGMDRLHGDELERLSQIQTELREREQAIHAEQHALTIDRSELASSGVMDPADLEAMQAQLADLRDALAVTEQQLMNCDEQITMAEVSLAQAARRLGGSDPASIEQIDQPALDALEHQVNQILDVRERIRAISSQLDLIHNDSTADGRSQSELHTARSLLGNWLELARLNPLEGGLWGSLALAALISINLGILNLLPIPVFDGGQIVFCLWEIIFRRPPNPRFQEYAMRVGIALLVCLMLLATYNDLWRILKNTGWFGSGS